MERTVSVYFTVLCCLTFLLFEIVSSHPHHNALRHTPDEEKPLSYLWVSRRKRNSAGGEYPENIEKELGEDDLQEFPWAIVAVNGKRHVVNFTPRLGRESGEEMGANGEERWILQEPAVSGEFLAQRSPPFAPRLGKRLKPIPRLGRESGKVVFSS